MSLSRRDHRVSAVETKIILKKRPRTQGQLQEAAMGAYPQEMSMEMDRNELAFRDNVDWYTNTLRFSTTATIAGR